MNRIIVVGLEKRFEKFESKIKQNAARILKILDQKEIALEIYLAEDRLMRDLNKKYRGKDKAADVLSFVEEKFPHPEFKQRFFGEIYLNLSHSSAVGCQSLLIHAILHLFGYTHQKKDDRIKMQNKENYVLHRFRHRDIKN